MRDLFYIFRKKKKIKKQDKINNFNGLQMAYFNEFEGITECKVLSLKLCNLLILWKTSRARVLIIFRVATLLISI